MDRAPAERPRIRIRYGQLFVSWNGPHFISASTRLQGFFIWRLVVYLIEALLFLLTGLQARIIAESLGEAD